MPGYARSCAVCWHFCYFCNHGCLCGKRTLLRRMDRHVALVISIDLFVPSALTQSKHPSSHERYTYIPTDISSMCRAASGRFEDSGRKGLRGRLRGRRSAREGDKLNRSNRCNVFRDPAMGDGLGCGDSPCSCGLTILSQDVLANVLLFCKLSVAWFKFAFPLRRVAAATPYRPPSKNRVFD